MKSNLEIDGIGNVRIVKRKGAKNMRIRLSPNGQVVLSMPRWAPKKAGVFFLNQHKGWINENRTDYDNRIYDGKSLGRAFKLRVVSTNKKRIISKLENNELTINLPKGVTLDDKKVLKHINDALKQKTKDDIFKKLEILSLKHGLNYKSVKTKLLTSRWGSCNSKKEIVLNGYLPQLPEELLEYVLMHELMHTKHMHHGKNFWQDLEELLPSTKQLKKELKKYQPRIY